MDTGQPMNHMDVEKHLDQPRLIISREAILHNIRLIKRQIRPGTKVCAMVKADAYGHGADVVVDALSNFEFEGLSSPAVDMLAVASLDEAASLPQTTLPILIFRPVENAYVGAARAEIEEAIRNDWILTIGTGSAADDVARIAMAVRKRALIHVMIDTGMTRCGCAIDTLADLLARIKSHSSLKLMSVGTHLATADVQSHDFITEQVACFRAATDDLASQTDQKVIRTVANSGGIFFAPTAHFDMVRPGISMYGIDPTCKADTNRPLRPVAKWVAPIISILPAKAGTCIGYGQTWRSPGDTRIGLVPIGYADGYLRQWGNHATMIVQGQPVPVVGRVSMDLTTIDLHHVPAAQIGDEVVVMDDDPLSPASAYALADLAQTIPYEVLTRIGSRVRRVGFHNIAPAAAEQRSGMIR